MHVFVNVLECDNAAVLWSAPLTPAWHRLALRCCPAGWAVNTLWEIGIVNFGCPSVVDPRLQSVRERDPGVRMAPLWLAGGWPHPIERQRCVPSWADAVGSGHSLWEWVQLDFERADSLCFALSACAAPCNCCDPPLKRLRCLHSDRWQHCAAA